MRDDDPYLDSGMKGWLQRMAHKHAWRVAGYSVEDLIQEGLCCYYKCKARYIGNPRLVGRDGRPGRYMSINWPTVQDRKHFMALVQATFLNRIFDLARRFPAGREVAFADLGTDEFKNYDSDVFAIESILPAEPELTAIERKIAQAPEEIRRVIDLIINDGLELTNRRKLGCTRHGRRRQTTDERLCKLLGIEAKPLRKMMEDHFLS